MTALLARLGRPLGRGLVAVALLASTGAIASCSASREPPPEFADPELAGRDVNPDGVPYPTDNLGGAERAGGRPGQRIPNFTFQAYVDGDRAAGLQTISLADFFDPSQKRFKIIDLQVAAIWCAVCTNVVNGTIPVKEKLGREGVVFLEVMVAGSVSTAGPSLAEVDEWITRHGSNYTTAIDVRARRLGGIGIDRAAVPYDLLIDARTMEILDSSVGAPVSVEGYVRDGLKYVASHPPSY